MDNMNNLKADIFLIKKKLAEYRKNNITDHFELEMKILEDLPEQYTNYPFLIKRLCKSEDETYLNKFIESLEQVSNGEKSLSSVELTLGLELKKVFIDPLINKN